MVKKYFINFFNFQNWSEQKINDFIFSFYLELTLSHCENINDGGIQQLCDGELRYCLESIDLDNCPLLTDESLRILSKCSKLKRVALVDCLQITWAGIDSLSRKLIRDNGIVKNCSICSGWKLWYSVIGNWRKHREIHLDKEHFTQPGGVWCQEYTKNVFFKINPWMYIFGSPCIFYLVSRGLLYKTSPISSWFFYSANHRIRKSRRYFRKDICIRM